MLRLSKLVVPAMLMMVATLTLTSCQWTPKQWFGQSGGPKNEVTVYFSKYQGSKSIVEPVTRELPKTEQAQPLHYAITELLEGPTAEERQQGFYSEIPKNTQLLGIHAKDKSITIDLSKQFTTGGGSNSIEQRLEELKQTTYAADTEHTLTVNVEGKPLELLGGEGLEVPATLQREAQ